MNDKHSFSCPWGCGCVTSRRAVAETNTASQCVLCQRPTDLLTPNPSDSMLTGNRLIDAIVEFTKTRYF